MTRSGPAERRAIYPVPVGLSEAHLAIVKDEIETTLLGLAQDLAYLDGKPHPQKFVSEVAAYARLAAALTTGTLRLPDRAARKALRRLAEELDDRNEYERVVAEHEAFRSFGRLLRTPPAASVSSKGRS
ncbi:MAG TPA: hypothetical protein VHZ54_14145 [Solirubrobacterales bacterium]|jgi:primosomal protein N''|nr:hypothetical protein [Solirubrobacterales bacterium]